MNILTPPRIESLGSQSIRVIVHTHKGTDTWSLKVYPFETIASVKQRIALHKSEDRAYMPSAVFLAKEAEGGFKPVEFRWDFAATVQDPLVVREPRGELMEGDVRKPVFPTLLQGLTVEAVGIQELHVWSLHTVAKDLSLTPAMFGGFLQFYFPMLERASDVEAMIAGDMTAAEKESMEAMGLFQERFLARLAKIESFLEKGTAPALQELRAFRIQLPRKATEESLEIRFHGMRPTKSMPILRFFSAQQRVPPLLKLATGPTGIPLLADAKLLRALMGDMPTAEQGSLMLGKAPLMHPKAPFGAAWVLRMYEDGGAELVLGAPRRDAPLMAPVVAAALQELPAFLKGTPWSVQDIADGSLAELTATYEFTLQQDIRKPSKSELKKRIEPFLPLFKEEAPQTGDAAALTLRWKAVSNFVAERDPVMSYITDLFLRDAFKSIDTIPVAMYVGAITREFGLGPKEAGAALSTWISRHAEYVLLDPDAPEKATAAHGIGSLVSIYNMHPNYRFYLAGVESYKDLQRILSALVVWVSHTSQELAGDVATAVAPEEEAAQPPPQEPEPAVDEGQMEEWYQAMEMYGIGEGDVGNAGDADIALVQDEQPQVAKPAQPLLEVEKDIRFPEPLGADEAPLPSLKQHFIKQLKEHDTDLFGYTTQVKDQGFSRTCQAHSNKQPHVMSPEAYQRVRSLYGDKVHWVEAPLSKYDGDALFVASKKVGERFKKFKAMRPRKEGDTEDSLLAEVFALEKRALRLGFPLKDGKSALEELRRDIDAEFETLKTQQAAKPLWIVVRAGTGRPNYYICAEFWCIRDDLPIIPNVEERGNTKIETCPFCGGRVFEDPAQPQKGETVLKRGPTGKSQPVAKYAGYMSNLFHPDGFVIPCCFTDPNNLVLPVDGKAIPDPLVELPKFQQDITAPVEKEKEEVKVSTKNIMDVFDSVKIKMDYSPKLKGLEEKFRYVDKDKKKVELMGKRILRTYILEASSFPLDAGKVGLLPPTFDSFLGQDRKQYLENPKHGEIYTHPEMKGRGFFRLGLGTKQRTIGSMIPQLIAYTRAAVSHIVPPLMEESLSVEDTLRDLFETREVLTFHAFQQANYGTLPAEFASDRPVADGMFQEWCGRMGIPLPAQRAHGMALYQAWLNFQDAMRDGAARKDLRLWEHLFAAPGLFSTTGVILAVLTTDANDHVLLRCPNLGIAQRQQWVKPPILMLFEDRKTRMVEPLVLYDGPDHLLGVLDPESTAFGSLHVSLRTPLTAFYSEYFDPAGGCGRPDPVLHTWVEDDATQGGLPPVGSLLYILRNQPEFAGWGIEAFVRDRTRRLVGLRIAVDGKSVLIPAVDDGTIDVAVGSLYDEEAIPYPSLAVLLQALVGAKEEGLSTYFRGLRPVERRSQGGYVVALELKGGCMVPFDPVRVDAVVSHPVYAAMKGDVEVDVLPWISLHPKEKEASPFLRNAEEQLEEAYQHLRLSVSEHLQKEQGLLKRIETLRSSTLPLFEKRKRMDLLLEIFKDWIHVGKKGETWDISALRRNCLKLDEGQCTDSCAWIRGSCLIHTVPTERFVDPAFVLLARLGDELLRTYGPAQQVLQAKVARLRPPTGVVKEKGSMMLAVEGRGDDEVYRMMGLEGRLPTKYTHGITIPEEMGEADVGCEDSHRGIPLTWVGVVPMVWPAAGVGQSLREIAWAALMGDAWKELEGMSEKDLYTAVAKRGYHVLLTTNACGGYKLAHWFAADAGEGRYIVLDPRRIPLASEKSKKPFLTDKELPSAIRQWMDESKRGVGVEEVLAEPEVLEEAEEDAYKRLEEVVKVDEEIPLDAFSLEGIDPALCLKAKNNPKFPFRSEELVEALQEEGFKIGKNASRERICKFVTEKTLRIVLRRRALAGKGPMPEKAEVPNEKPQSAVPVPAVPQPLVEPQEPQEVPEAEAEAKPQESQEPNMSKIEVERCNPGDGYHPVKFPFKRPELIEELRNRKVKIALNATLEKICPHVTPDVLQAILRKRGQTQKNRLKTPKPVELPKEPEEPPKEAVDLPKEPEDEDVKTPPFNFSKIDKCSKGYSAQFPFKRPELIEALREQGIFVAKAATLDKICPRVTEETLRYILKKKALQTRKNKANKGNRPRMEIVEEQ